ncbi:MAG: VCBS repeat-containing protein [Candidatus Sabulitectum sp.]|nr:VCBS repeat-containing protein [Candidatus Sabulitectum sp.]
MDWDGDGLNDLVIGQGSNNLGSVQVFFNNGNGTLSDPFYVCTVTGEPILSNSGSAFIQVLDFIPDDDESFDLLVGMSSSSSTEFVLVFENDPDTWIPPYNPVFLEPVPLTSVGEPVDHSPSCQWIGDIDSDGFPDLVVSDYRCLFFFYPGTGPMGTMDFAEQDTICTPSGPIIAGDTPHPCLCDWDGDGDLDLLTGSNYTPDDQRTSCGVYLYRNPLFSGMESQETGSDEFLELSVNTPARNLVEITIQSSCTGSISLDIYSIDGRRVMSDEGFPEASGTLQKQLDISFLPPGFYSLVAVAEQQRSRACFVILPL